jgi:hypothetical protein
MAVTLVVLDETRKVVVLGDLSLTAKIAETQELGSLVLSEKIWLKGTLEHYCLLYLEY